MASGLMKQPAELVPLFNACDDIKCIDQLGQKDLGIWKTEKMRPKLPLSNRNQQNIQCTYIIYNYIIKNIQH